MGPVAHSADRAVSLECRINIGLDKECDIRHNVARDRDDFFEAKKKAEKNTFLKKHLEGFSGVQVVPCSLQQGGEPADRKA